MYPKGHGEEQLRIKQCTDFRELFRFHYVWSGHSECGQSVLDYPDLFNKI